MRRYMDRRVVERKRGGETKEEKDKEGSKKEKKEDGKEGRKLGSVDPYK